MKTKFLCLANSCKYNDYYLAGIELEEVENGFKYKLDENKSPKWIRPKLSLEHAKEWSEAIRLFDIVEVEILERCPDGCHSENVKVDERYIQIIKNEPLTTQNLKKLINHTSRSLFGNKGTSLNRKRIESLKNSLALIKAQKPQFYSSSPSRKGKLRLKFYYNNHLYDLPVTDRAFSDDYEYFRPILVDPNHTYLTISLDTMPNERHYKVVAGVLKTAS